MGKGFLQMQLFCGDNALPVANMPITVHDAHGNLLHELVSDTNGLAGPVELYASDITSDDPMADIPRSYYMVRTPRVHGYVCTLRKGVQIFAGQTTTLPLQLRPLLDDEEPTCEIIIPEEHGGEYGGPRFEGDNYDIINKFHINSSAYIIPITNLNIGENMGKGFLRIQLFCGDNALPVADMPITVHDAHGNMLHELVSDKNGLAGPVELHASDIASDDPMADIPRSYYMVRTPRVHGYVCTLRKGVQIFAGQTTTLPLQLRPLLDDEEPTCEIIIPEEHGCEYGGPRFEGDDIEAIQQELGRVLRDNNIVIPTYITVHLGHPDQPARNVRVPFIDYIKNVASSEIFPTWHESAITANILAQITFALNRLWTEWYRSRGRAFDITNNTRFDQFFVYGRDIFDTLSHAVDRIFNNFLKRLGRAEPFFSIYFDGRQARCCGMSQWGSQDLALRGRTPIQILRHYYPNDIDIFESTNFANLQESYPGTPLREGSRGDAVRLAQIYLNRISGDFWMPNVGQPNGIFGPEMTASVTAFQRIFNLTADGVIGRETWYAMIRIFVAVKRLAELDSEGKRIGIGTAPPTSTIRLNSRGEDVVKVQFLINFISQFYDTIPFVPEDGVFRAATRDAVIEFQRRFGLTADGIVGTNTWRRLYEVYHRLYNTLPIPPETAIPAFPGVPLANGSQGEDVRRMQRYLAAISRRYTNIPSINADGIFGPLTQGAVTAFQQQFGLPQTGIIDRDTWYHIYDIYSELDNTTAPSPPPPPPPGPPSPPINNNPPYPGTPIRIGERSDNVRTIQRFLNEIGRTHPGIPPLNEDGVFGPLTQASIIAFQRMFGLSPDGVVGPITWARLVEVYNESKAFPPFPGASLRIGDRGENVRAIQAALNRIGRAFPAIPPLNEDGSFGPLTQNSVRVFQQLFGLNNDGVVGPITWGRISSVLAELRVGGTRLATYAFPGASVRIGERGENVRTMQRLLNAVIAHTPALNIPRLAEDGAFGPITEGAVRAFQQHFGLTVDGIIGAKREDGNINLKPTKI